MRTSLTLLGLGMTAVLVAIAFAVPVAAGPLAGSVGTALSPMTALGSGGNGSPFLLVRGMHGHGGFHGGGFGHHGRGFRGGFYGGSPYFYGSPYSYWDNDYYGGSQACVWDGYQYVCSGPDYDSY